MADAFSRIYLINNKLIGNKKAKDCLKSLALLRVISDLIQTMPLMNGLKLGGFPKILEKN
ncbi:hypothetical protein GCM10007422_01560 [Pedobacter zeae]|uniref:Uncharacterized protein n=1 Tax=Pedobacter zeae TaxID=1737356 RepID=A0A7W6KDF1_9SPHI|nr:hypothetical protein [Pedobacter zeae]MBB4108527.1 hypothetical protein [Pedobacter zeae]GGG92245.1 hypothetical protein GCM10007422_01560 [Pedobacter zeae]